MGQPLPTTMNKKIITALILVLLTSVSFAGVGGKIAGKISSLDGTIMAGVNVVINETSLGTASDLDGDYFILNVPPGTYTIRFMMIGYKTAVYQEVQVISDFTTRLNTVLEPVAHDALEEVIVTASRPLIQKDATSTIHVVGADDIVAMPVSTFKDVLVTQAGFTEDASGGIHVRGGRTKEILYMIDGIVVRDPLEGDFSGSVNQDAIQEMTVISGTFNAEYGQAMSSVVNIVTKEGGSDFSGKMEFTSDQLNESPYHESGAFEYIDPSYANVDSAYIYPDQQDSVLFSYIDNAPDDYYVPGIIPMVNLPVKGKVSLSFGGPLPIGNTHYFASMFYSELDNPLPYGININQDVQLKLSNKITRKLKLVAHLHSTSRLSQSYSHTWKYLPENHAHTYQSNDRLALKLTHSPSRSVFYNIHVTQQSVSTRVGVKALLPEDYERPATDKSVYFYESGHEGIINNNQSITASTGFNLTWQANQQHQIKTGFLLDKHRLEINTEEEPWEGGVNFKDDTSFSPSEGSFYVQDKIEYDFMIFNLGIRFDQINPQINMWEDLTRFTMFDSTTQTWGPAPTVETESQTKWSPRIGLAYPVTDNTVFHFSYGHFFQSPNFRSMTYNASKDITSSLPLVGNPKVKPQKTVAFEVGLKQALSADTRLELTVWSKDIRDLLSTEMLRFQSNTVIVYSNSDYASVKGIDLSIDRQFSGHFGADLSYTLSVARGNNSSPIAGYFSAYTNEEIPHKEYFLSFDQRHDLSFNLSLRSFAKEGFQLGSLYPLSNINANLLISAGSGLPYTPYVDPSIRVEENSARKPWTFTLDLRVKKSINLGSLRSSVFFEAINLTDYENILVVSSRTGEPFNSGASGLVGANDDGNLNPAKLGPGRAAKLGLSVSW